MIYDSQVVKDAGLSALPSSWTWDDYAQYAGKISKALSSKQIYGSPDSSGAIDIFEIWVRQQGHELYTSDGVCLGAVVGNLISCSMAAYAFARLRFRYKAFWFIVMQGIILLPMHAMIVPQYILFKDLGWVNTFLPLIAPKFLATDEFFVFLMIQFIRGIPGELDDAAQMDGCGRLAFYWRVVLPLSLPALVTSAIFTFIWTWNDFFTQLIYLNDESLYTIPLALRTFLDSTGNSAYGQLFAMSVLSLLPVIVFFLLFQRMLIEGAATTGLKG